jgi:septal ring factor EnvC (AmiA/AmiB activator)
VREQLETRLKALEQEFEKGKTLLQQAERERAELEATLLRLDGAITALREALAEDQPEDDTPNIRAAPAQPR